MNEFSIWFTTGLEHILDWNGYDHIFYVIALCVMFSVKEWKRLLILVTAFTIGHSLTLAASTLNIISVKQMIIELLIPLTIIATCSVNIWYSKKKNRETINLNYRLNYILALVFGFVHGLGFSYLLKSMLGQEESIWFPLLSFNLGLELGQIIIVLTVLLISLFLVRFTKFRKTLVEQLVSIFVLLVATFLFVERLNDL